LLRRWGVDLLFRFFTSLPQNSSPNPNYMAPFIHAKTLEEGGNIRLRDDNEEDSLEAEEDEVDDTEDHPSTRVQWTWTETKR
jgi:hypothetical protein